MLNIPLRLTSTLSQSKSSFLAAHLLPSGKQYASLVVAAAIVDPGRHKILLLKRSPAEKLFPHHWEIPGGKVDDTDKTIWDALKREVSEETGLCIKESDVIQGEIGFEWALGEDAKQSDIMQAEMGFGWGLDEVFKDEVVKDEVVKDEVVEDDTEMALELNFMVESRELSEVKLDPEEHLESLWVDEKDIVGLQMTPEMRCVVEDALDFLPSFGILATAMGILVIGWVIAAVWSLFVAVLSLFLQ